MRYRYRSCLVHGAMSLTRERTISREPLGGKHHGEDGTALITEKTKHSSPIGEGSGLE